MPVSVCGSWYSRNAVDSRLVMLSSAKRRVSARSRAGK
jgi:hypothetical protein